MSAASTLTGHDLARLDLFADVDGAELDELAASLTPRRYEPGEVVFGQGEPGRSFVVVIDGRLAVRRHGRDADLDLGAAGPGSILGELSMLTGKPRRATVTATTSVEVGLGDAEAFDALLGTTGIPERLTDVAAQRLARIARVVPVTLRDGTELGLRPLLPSDRDELEAALNRQPAEWLRRRFFSSGRPSARVVDFLVNISYVDHFAWVIGDEERHGVATARYVRTEETGQAELAFEVADDWRGRGVGTLLLGALAVAASSAGIDRFCAEVLHDNIPMRAVLDKAGATWRLADPGVGVATLGVAEAAALIPAALQDAVRPAVVEVVTGAGLALLRNQ